MKVLMRRAVIVTMALALAVALGAPSAQAKCGPKIDNFMFFVDQSGSMYQMHAKLGVVKMAAAIQVLNAMIDIIPEYGYKGSMYLFAPIEKLLDPTVFSKPPFAAAAKKIKGEQEIFGRRTPMGLGYEAIAPIVGGMSGKSAVIMISDGGQNLGPDPVPVVQAMKAKNPNLAVHVVSLAVTPEEKAYNEAVAKAGGGILVEAATLCADKTALTKFVKDVFEVCVPDEKETMILRGINFDFDKYNIKPEFRPVLDEAVATLMKTPNMKVVLEGHTDSIGSDAYNMKLSERRARSVFDYFLKKGVKADRMKTVGYGESKPIADNSTEKGRYMNRRVEIQYVK